MAQRTDPVMSRPRLTALMTPFVLLGAVGAVCGHFAPGIFVVACTLILWASIEKWMRPSGSCQPERPCGPCRAVFTGEPNPDILPTPQTAARPVPCARREALIRALADDERTPHGERVAAREALRRTRSR